MDVDDTNLKTTITVPVGYLLVVTANGGGTEVNVGINIDGSVANLVNIGIDVGPIPFSVAASLVGDGSAHTVTLRFESFSGFGAEAEIANSASDSVPTMTLVLLPSI